MRKIRLASLLLMAVVFSAAAFSAEGAADVAAANLVVYRATDNQALNFRVAIDGRHVGKLKSGKAFRLRLDPGEHVVSLNDREKTSVVVKVEEQGVTYVRSEISRKLKTKMLVVEPSAQEIASTSAYDAVVVLN